MRRVSLNRDAAEPEVIEALEDHGFSVLKIAVKDGPDLVIARDGFTALVEVKTGKAKLKPGQVTFAQRWGATVYVLRSRHDVERMVQGCPVKVAQ